MDEYERIKKSEDHDKGLVEGTDKVSLFEMLSENLDHTPPNTPENEIESLLKALADTVENFLVSPNTKYKSREFYRHIRNLQQAYKRHSANSTISREIVKLIDKLNMASLYLSASDKDDAVTNYYDEEDRYWTDLEIQENDPSYLSLADEKAIEYMDEIYAYDGSGVYHLNELRAFTPDEFRHIMRQFDDIDDFAYWHEVDEQIANDEPIEGFFDDDEDIESLNENRIQSDPDLAILDNYRDSLLFLDNVPNDKIKVVFWQSDFDKLNDYCAQNGISTLMQLFDTDLNSLYGHGFNHTRIMQISAIMEEWARKYTDQEEVDIVFEDIDKNHDEILSFFFSDDDSDAEDDEDEDDEPEDDEDY